MSLMLKRILFFILILSSGCMADNSEKNFQLYWTEFRTAALAADYEKLEKLTRFPLEVKGVDDSMPSVQYKKEDFQGVFKKIMAQPIYQLREDDLIETTMRAVVDKMDVVPEEITGEERRVEQLEFQNIEGRWFLVSAYLEE